MKYLVFDVESIGLHGEGFSVGWVIVDGHGQEEECGFLACSPDSARGNTDGREWVSEHIDVSGHTNNSPLELRSAFWRKWKEAKSQGCVLVADCPWPVEARFLIECVNDDPMSREWEGPYPLIDVASVRLASGLDPLGKEERLGGENPEHNPVCDARQSARLFIEALNHG